MGGPKLWIAGVVLGIGVLAIAAYGIAFGLNRQHQPPEQPIRFPHQWHIQSAGVECLFCHRTAATGVSGGLPAVEQCMFCHRVAGRQSPEIQKLTTVSDNMQPIDWVHVYRVPDHVRFTHQPHYQAGVDCSSCHGDVKNSTLLVQVQRMKMGFCVTCHRQQNARTDCWSCHY
ncbi:MAG TPA: cytochrome c3 family protein [Chloroflexota bacterium]|nr:cytochrome c3 family protein [Chloroflexota bacterium]